MAKRVTKRKPAPKSAAPKKKAATRAASGKRRPAKKKAAPPPEPAPLHLPYIAESLHPLAVPIESLQPDPANARTHSERNRAAIRASLARFGQRTPLVVLADGTIQAGNGRWEEARQLGWTHIAVVRVTDDPATATGYALADNRTAELSGWDDKLLASHLQALDDLDDFDLADTGFDQDELTALVESSLQNPPREKPPAPANPQGAAKPQFHVLVRCADADDQNALCSQLQEEGIKCRPHDV